MILTTTFCSVCNKQQVPAMKRMVTQTINYGTIHSTTTTFLFLYEFGWHDTAHGTEWMAYVRN